MVPETSSCIQRSVAVRDRIPSHTAGGVQRAGSHEASLFSSTSVREILFVIAAAQGGDRVSK
jgi:hypothetical protein